MSNSDLRVAVVGGGIAGLTAAEALADVGASVLLVERQHSLGGHAAEWACMATDECAKCSACTVQSKIQAVARHGNIQVIAGSQVVSASGREGDFRLALDPSETRSGHAPCRPDWVPGRSQEIFCDCVVLATGFKEYDAGLNPLLGYKRLSGVLTTRDVDQYLLQDNLDSFLPPGDQKVRIGFIQCVGSRDRKSNREYCSQFCCRTSIRLIRRLQYLRPSLQATIFYIDLQTMSKEFHSFYERAKESVEFIQGVPAEVCPGEGADELRVFCVKPGADRAEAVDFDRVVLAVGVTPGTNQQELARIFDLELNEFGFFNSSGESPGLTTSRPGIFVAGACAGPADIQGSRKQALAVAARIVNSARREGRDSRTTGKATGPAARVSLQSEIK